MALALYSVLRLALLLIVAAALYAVGLRGWPLILVAAAVALMLSYVLLGRQRDAAAVALAERKARRAASGTRFSPGAEDDAAVEDAQIESASPARPSPEGASGSDRKPQAE